MSRRLLQINQLIKKELSQILLKEIEASPDLLVTVTRVETSSDLMESNVWVSVFPERKQKEIFEELNEKIYLFQQKLNKRLNMRPVPKIRFLTEKKTKEAGEIEEILGKLKKNEK